MERRWFKNTIARLTDYQYQLLSRYLYTHHDTGPVYRPGFLVATVLLAVGSFTVAFIYDWYPDVAKDPIYLLQVPFLLWPYTWSASLVLAFFDPTGFFPAEMATVYFTYMTLEIIMTNRSTHENRVTDEYESEEPGETRAE